MWKTPPCEGLIGAAFEVAGKGLSCCFLLVYAQHQDSPILQTAAQRGAEMLHLQVTHYQVDSVYCWIISALVLT